MLQLVSVRALALSDQQDSDLESVARGLLEAHGPRLQSIEMCSDVTRLRTSFPGSAPFGPDLTAFVWSALRSKYLPVPAAALKTASIAFLIDDAGMIAACADLLRKSSTTLQSLSLNGRAICALATVVDKGVSFARLETLEYRGQANPNGRPLTSSEDVFSMLNSLRAPRLECLLLDNCPRLYLHLATSLARGGLSSVRHFRIWGNERCYREAAEDVNEEADDNAEEEAEAAFLEDERLSRELLEEFLGSRGVRVTSGF